MTQMIWGSTKKAIGLQGQSPPGQLLVERTTWCGRMDGSLPSGPMGQHP